MESDGRGERRNYRFGDKVMVEDRQLQRATRDGWGRVGRRVAIVFGKGLKKLAFSI